VRNIDRITQIRWTPEAGCGHRKTTTWRINLHRFEKMANDYRKQFAAAGVDVDR